MSSPQVVRAAGVLIVVGDRSTARPSQFLLMRHGVIDDHAMNPDAPISKRSRWDLPKGHCDGEETFRQTALRELAEETGIDVDWLEFDPEFVHDVRYIVDTKRYGGRVEKWVRYFLAWVDRVPIITPTEHDDFHWFDWDPPHHIQSQTVDDLLGAVWTHLKHVLNGHR